MNPRIEVLDDAASLATAVAGELLGRLSAAQSRGERPHVALTGGSIAEAIHRELGRLGPGSEVAWDEAEFWWGDERYVAAGSDERNAGPARAAFLDRVGVPTEHVHEPPATDSIPSLEQAAAAYGREWQAHGPDGLEVLMLGIGPDGHVASLFPGHPALEVTDTVAVGVADSPKPPPQRISLTLPTLNRSRAVWFVASGGSKAEAVARALSADGSVTETPARGVVGRPDGSTEVCWFLDRPAASLL